MAQPAYRTGSDELHGLQVVRHPMSSRLRFDGNSPGYHLRQLLASSVKQLLWAGGWRGGPRSIRRLRQLENSRNGKRALIVANGPSAESLEPDHLHGFVSRHNEIFLVNDFRSNKALEGLERFHYVTSDPGSVNTGIAQEIIGEYSQSIQVVFCPAEQREQIVRNVPLGDVVGFCDVQAKTWSRARTSTRPDRPRSYASWTALKALSIALWLGYDEIGIIGYDQSFVREVYSDQQNRILLKETHAGEAPFFTDRSLTYFSFSDYFFEFYQLFRSIEELRSDRLLNLDPYSLTTVFRKVSSPAEVFKFLLQPPSSASSR